MKKQAFVLTLGVVLLSVVVGMGMLAGVQAHKNSAGGGAGAGNGAAAYLAGGQEHGGKIQNHPEC